MEASSVMALSTGSSSTPLTGVPAVIVAGKYVTDIAMAGSPARVMDVVNFLVRKESAKN